MSIIFESHAHYEDEAFDEDREALITSLPQNQIGYVMNVGSTVETCHKSVELAAQYDFVYAALGIHPTEIHDVTEDDFTWIKEQALTNSKVRAIGEIGLDYYWEKENSPMQKEFFIRQINLAKEVKKPVIIHSREAAKDTFDIMKAENAAQTGGVVHCFSYPVEEAKKYLDMGFYIGLGGAVTFKNAVKVKEVAAYVPLDRILLETDCPYMAPVPYRGKRNSSLYIPEIARQIAELKGIDCDTIIEAATHNAKRMYGINE